MASPSWADRSIHSRSKSSQRHGFIANVSWTFVSVDGRWIRCAKMKSKQKAASRVAMITVRVPPRDPEPVKKEIEPSETTRGDMLSPVSLCRKLLLSRSLLSLPCALQTTHTHRPSTTKNGHVMQTEHTPRPGFQKTLMQNARKYHRSNRRANSTPPPPFHNNLHEHPPMT